jgi:hypothetical protein
LDEQRCSARSLGERQSNLDDMRQPIPIAFGAALQQEGLIERDAPVPGGLKRFLRSALQLQRLLRIEESKAGLGKASLSSSLCATLLVVLVRMDVLTSSGWFL